MEKYLIDTNTYTFMRHEGIDKEFLIIEVYECKKLEETYWLLKKTNGEYVIANTCENVREDNEEDATLICDHWRYGHYLGKDLGSLMNAIKWIKKRVLGEENNG